MFTILQIWTTEICIVICIQTHSHTTCMVWAAGNNPCGASHLIAQPSIYSTNSIGAQEQNPDRVMQLAICA